jgi:putative radical SAM enzyme (TIGR03279 family)
MKIVDICKSSPLCGKIPIGANLLKVNGHPVADGLDFQFHNTEDTLVLEITYGGERSTIELDTITCGDLGLVFEESKIKICNNNCIFCFVHQQPKGMRRNLYIKDDDFQYSFTHGNFISLSTTTEADFERIITQRLSPLYISVHATDDKLRRCIFQNEKLEPILPQIKRLVDNNITLHTQTVICPGINDGEHLHKTITDLAALAPGVDSLAVVPVGLTKYRERLPELRTYTGKEAGDVLDLVEAYHRRFLDELGTRFVYPADEWFLNAQKDIPPLGYYEEMPQFENGVGMLRQFMVDFNRRKRYLPRNIKRSLNLAIITGRLAEPILGEKIWPGLNEIENLKPELIAVDNNFWGETVTVTGLLTGKDILNAVKDSKADIIMLPPNCLNTDDLFLDDMSLDQFSSEVGRPVITGSYNFVETLIRAIKIGEA